MPEKRVNSKLFQQILRDDFKLKKTKKIRESSDPNGGRYFIWKDSDGIGYDIPSPHVNFRGMVGKSEMFYCYQSCLMVLQNLLDHTGTYEDANEILIKFSYNN